MFIYSLKGFPQLKICSDKYIGEYAECVIDNNGNTIKYDHHPYLFEIATAPANTMNQLKRFLDHCFNNINEAAELLSLNISFDPLLWLPTDDPKTFSNLDFRKNLISYRSKIFELKNRPIDKQLINYAAGIISTQIHIGGIPFSKYNEVFPELYENEIETINWSKTKVISHLAPAQLLKKREYIYKEMFKNYPLVCFPSFKWSVDNWINALFESPLFGTSTEYFSGYSVNDLPELKEMNTMEFLERVRDLQWIKPHRQGTIEFRSIPALPDINSIIELTSMRLDKAKKLMSDV